MRRLRYRRLVVAGGLAVAALGALVYLLWPGPRVTLTDMTPLCAGDTRAEVYAKIGGPPGDYRRNGFVGSIPGRPADRDVTTAETWTCDDGVLHVWFDADGRLIDLIGLPSHDLRPTLLQRIKWKLGL
jgi:hypothetical protein